VFVMVRKMACISSWSKRRSEEAGYDLLSTTLNEEKLLRLHFEPDRNDFKLLSYAIDALILNSPANLRTCSKSAGLVRDTAKQNVPKHIHAHKCHGPTANS